MRKAGEARNKVLDAQKTVARLEVHAVILRKRKVLGDRCMAATAAVEVAKRHLVEQRLREKDALEATKKALEEARSKAREAKGFGRGAAKRAAAPAQEPASKRAATEAHTVP